ncbi:hypothetical protein MIR68_000196 [Amoeboaphelidium protococcarum]|nr:hypothetical protein MIR68_000196 [Amoeboaphelidium protococcarum]
MTKFALILLLAATLSAMPMDFGDLSSELESNDGFDDWRATRRNSGPHQLRNRHNAAAAILRLNNMGTTQRGDQAPEYDPMENPYQMNPDRKIHTSRRRRLIPELGHGKSRLNRVVGSNHRSVIPTGLNLPSDYTPDDAPPIGRGGRVTPTQPAFTMLGSQRGNAAVSRMNIGPLNGRPISSGFVNDADGRERTQQNEQSMTDGQQYGAEYYEVGGQQDW